VRRALGRAARQEADLLGACSAAGPGRWAGPLGRGPRNAASRFYTCDPKWARYGKGAGSQVNRQLVGALFDAEVFLVSQSAKVSPTTLDLIRRARKAGIEDILKGVVPPGQADPATAATTSTKADGLRSARPPGGVSVRRSPPAVRAAVQANAVRVNDDVEGSRTVKAPKLTQEQATFAVTVSRPMSHFRPALVSYRHNRWFALY